MPPVTRARSKHRTGDKMTFTVRVKQCSGAWCTEHKRAGVLASDMCNEPCNGCEELCCDLDSVYVMAEFGHHDTFYRITLLCTNCLFSGNYTHLNNDKYPGICFVRSSWSDDNWGSDTAVPRRCECCRTTAHTTQCVYCDHTVCFDCCKQGLCKVCRATRYLQDRAFSIAPNDTHPLFRQYHTNNEVNEWSSVYSKL